MSEDWISSRKNDHLEAMVSEVFHPALREEGAIFAKYQKECEEYAKVLFTCQNLMNSNDKTIDTKVDIGMKIYVNAEVRDTKHILMKLGGEDELLLKMTLEQAVKFSERKMEFLKKCMSRCQSRISSLNTRVNLMLAEFEVDVGNV